MRFTPQQRLERAHVALMRDREYMFLSGIIVHGESTVSKQERTAKTDGINVIYGEQFIGTLDDAQLRGLVLHEKKHCAYRHLTTWRSLYEQDHTLANLACDAVINLEILDRERRDGFVRLPPGGFVDERFRGMDSGQVFALLKQGTGGKGMPQHGSLDTHDWDGAQQRDKADGGKASREIEQALRQGGILASKAGANVDRAILDMLQPKVDWREVLREFVVNSVPGNDYTTYRRFDRRFQSQDLTLPASYSDNLYRVMIAVDTSGSIMDGQLSEFLAEVQGVCESVKPQLVDLVYWGHIVARHETYDASNIDTLRSSTRPKGGGGTSPSCVTRYMQERSITPDCVVVLTDGDVGGDWGNNWNAPVLWCINNKYNTAPLGVTVHI